MHLSITPQVIDQQDPITHRHISPKGNNRHHSRMDDIYMIRRKNLAVVCTDKVGGNQSELGRALGLASNLVNRYLRVKRIGDDVARAVEVTYGLERGWMDHSHPTDLESMVLLAYRNAHPEIQAAVARALNLPFTQAQVINSGKRKTA